MPAFINQALNIPNF